MGNFLQHWKVPLQNKSAQWDKSFRHYCESLFHWKKLSEAKLFWKKEGFFYKLIDTVRKKVFDKIVTASLIEKNFQNQKFSETKKDFSTKYISTVRQKVFDKIVRASLIEKNLQNQKVSETLEDYSKKCFGTVKQEKIRGKIVITPHPLLSIKKSRNGKFSATLKGSSTK